MKLCMFLSTIDGLLGRSSYSPFSFKRGPFRGRMRGGSPSCLLPSKTGTVDFWPLFFSFKSCIPTTWIFACAGLSAVSDLDNILRYLLRYWGSFYFLNISDIFGGDSEVISEYSDHASKFFRKGDPEVSAHLLDVYVRAGFVFTFRFPWWVSSIVAGVCPQRFPIFLGVIQSSRKHWSVTMSDVPGSLHLSLCFSCLMT